MLYQTTPPSIDKLLRLSEVCELTALKKTTVYKRIRLRQFPQQTQIGAPGARRGTARWKLSSVSEWIEAQKSSENLGLCQSNWHFSLSQKRIEGARQ